MFVFYLNTNIRISAKRASTLPCVNRVLLLNSLDALPLSFWLTRWKSLSAAGRKHKAKNLAFGWMVKLPKMWNYMALVSSVFSVVFRQTTANNCKSLYKSVILNVNIFQREKLHTDAAAFFCTLLVLSVCEFGCVMPLMFMTQTFRQERKHFWRKCKWRDQLGVRLILGGASCSGFIGQQTCGNGVLHFVSHLKIESKILAALFQLAVSLQQYSFPVMIHDVVYNLILINPFYYHVISDNHHSKPSSVFTSETSVFHWGDSRRREWSQGASGLCPAVLFIQI